VTHVAVLGPGGVGGLVAAALDRAGTPVTVVAREPTAQVIERDGIDVESVRLGEFIARPRAPPALTSTVDVLVIATTANALVGGHERVGGPPPALVVPLLNGVDHVARLRERFGAAVVAGTIRVQSDRRAPGEIVQTSPFLRVDLATDDPAPRERMEAFAHLLRAAEIPTRLGASEAEVLWSKLVRLNALACTTTAYDAPLGAIRDRPDWRADLVGAVEEAATVARAEGAPADAGATIEELWGLPPESGSSMQRDVAAGLEPELDAIAGAVLRGGTRHGIPCPAVEGLVARIRARMAASAPR